ncbi:MAG: lysophospholipid acyltransferase family protein [Ardenticatenia bacterium]|nr:lysophospholipid acyltransferase family protein [Ardenticatenia bacterium]
MSRTRLYWPMRALLRALFRLGRWHVEGLDYVPQQGPLIVASNHLNLLDAPLVMASLPIGPITVMAKAEYGRWFSPAGWILRTVDVIFVRRGHVDRRALRAALEVLHQGGRIGLAPEGTRSRHGGCNGGARAWPTWPCARARPSCRRPCGATNALFRICAGGGALSIGCALAPWCAWNPSPASPEDVSSHRAQSTSCVRWPGCFPPRIGACMLLPWKDDWENTTCEEV